MSSLWNVNIGHGRQEIADVAKEQMSTLAFSSCFATFSNEPAIRLAAKIASLAPGDLNTVFFTSGGSEANDTAIKLARHYWLLKGQPKRQKNYFTYTLLPRCSNGCYKCNRLTSIS